MRKYFLDNIRWICILILFPYHAFMMYNNWGENFYIEGNQNAFMSGVIPLVWAWIMPLMFAIAGMAVYYALLKRTPKQYLKERVFKILIPLIAGILLVIPIQTFYAEKFHNGYTGGFFNQFIMFFTKSTDFSGARGGFTPGQLWFLVFLFIISLIALPIFMLTKKSKRKYDIGNMPYPFIIMMFIIPSLFSFVPDIAGKNIAEFFAFFMLGYYVLSNDKILEKTEKYKWWLLAGFITLTVTCVLFLNVFDINEGILFDIFYRVFGWVAVLAILGLGKSFLNQNNKFTKYMTKASYPVYIFHQTFLIMTAYYIFKVTSVTALQVFAMITISMALTFLCYEIFRRIPHIGFIFGIKAKSKIKLNDADGNKAALEQEENFEKNLVN